MSEPQNEYETESETDAEPTPGPWEIEDGHWDIEVTKGEYVIATAHAAVPNGALKENARLIAAAGTAAQEAREMGYKPVATMKALPQILSQIESLLQGEYEHEGVIFPGTMDLLRELGGSPLEKDALASAEGSGE